MLAVQTKSSTFPTLSMLFFSLNFTTIFFLLFINELEVHVFSKMDKQCGDSLYIVHFILHTCPWCC